MPAKEYSIWWTLNFVMSNTVTQIIFVRVCETISNCSQRAPSSPWQRLQNPDNSQLLGPAPGSNKQPNMVKSSHKPTLPASNTMTIMSSSLVHVSADQMFHMSQMMTC